MTYAVDLGYDLNIDFGFDHEPVEWTEEQLDNALGLKLKGWTWERIARKFKHPGRGAHLFQQLKKVKKWPPKRIPRKPPKRIKEEIPSPKPKPKPRPKSPPRKVEPRRTDYTFYEEEELISFNGNEHIFEDDGYHQDDEGAYQYANDYYFDSNGHFEQNSLDDDYGYVEEEIEQEEEEVIIEEPGGRFTLKPLKPLAPFTLKPILKAAPFVKANEPDGSITLKGSVSSEKADSRKIRGIDKNLRKFIKSLGDRWSVESKLLMEADVNFSDIAYFEDEDFQYLNLKGLRKRTFQRRYQEFAERINNLKSNPEGSILTLKFDPGGKYEVDVEVERSKFKKEEMLRGSDVDIKVLDCGSDFLQLQCDPDMTVGDLKTALTILITSSHCMFRLVETDQEIMREIDPEIDERTPLADITKNFTWIIWVQRIIWNHHGGHR